MLCAPGLEASEVFSRVRCCVTEIVYNCTQRVLVSFARAASERWNMLEDYSKVNYSNQSWNELWNWQV